MMAFPSSMSPNFLAAVTFLLLSLICVTVDGASVMDVHRLIQYDLHGEPLGSRKSNINQYASLAGGPKNGRSVVVLPLAEVDVAVVNELVQNKAAIAGILFVLPEDFEENGVDGDAIAELEQSLVSQKIDMPIYFAVDNEELQNMMTELKKMLAMGRSPSPSLGGHRLVVNAKEPKKIDLPTLENYQCKLTGTAKEDGSPKPTIAIVSYYDTFGIVPSLAVGADSNGSGLVSFLELLRLFSRLYKDARTKGEYDLLFVLTAGGALNYAGAEHWLDQAEQATPNVLEAVEFVLCLDSLGGWGGGGANDEGLFLHISRPPKEEDPVKDLYDEFEAVAVELDIPLTIKQKKVNISAATVAWEHEQFAKRKLIAGTLSARRAPLGSPGFSSLADRGPRAVNATSVGRAVRLVAETLVRHMYGHSGRQLDTFAQGSSRQVRLEHIEQSLKVLTSTPRAVPYHLSAPPSTKPLTPRPVSAGGSASDDSMGALLLAALRQVLAEYSTEATVMPFKLDPRSAFTPYQFHSITTAQLEVYQSASIMFDIYVVVGIAAYLGLLFLALALATRGWPDTLAIFTSKPLKKSKSG